MQTTIKKWGNSQGLYIPKATLKALNWNINDSVTLTVHGNTIVIEKNDASMEKADAFNNIRSLRKAVPELDADAARSEYLEEKYGL